MSASRLVLALNTGTTLNLPSWSAAPVGEAATIAGALLAAGYRGIQGTGEPAAYRAAGLATYGSGRVEFSEQALLLLQQQADAGHLCTTLHVGTGFEDNDAAFRLIEAVLTASAQLGHPAHIETHRATITQDIWRTLQWIKRFPEMTINADYSHWYTGLEMRYGDFDEKLAIMQPIFDRVRFVHGRIGTGGAMQVAVGIGGRDEPHVSLISKMWERSFAGFLANAGAGETIVFAPELLPEAVIGPDGPNYIEYALTTRTENGQFGETSDRWEQGLRLNTIAEAAFERALAAAKPVL